MGAAVVSGTLADRYDRRWLLKLVSIVALGASIAIAAVLWQDPTAAFAIVGPAGFTVPLWLLLVIPLWASLTAAVTIFRPTFNSALPKLVETRQLGTANGLLYAVTVAISAGVQVGTGLLVLEQGAVTALLVPIILLAFSLYFLIRLGPEAAAGARKRERTFLTDAKEGYRYLGIRRELLGVTIAALAINFLSAVAFVELAAYSAFFLDQSPAFLGYLYAVGTLGAGTGALVINRIPFERHLGRFIGLMTLLMGVSVAGFALTHSAVVALTDMFLFGMFPGMIQTGFVAGVQATVPNKLLGRVFAADEVGSYAFVPAGQYVGGVVTFSAGIPVAFLGSGAGMAVVGAGLLLTPVIGKFRFDPSTPPPSDATPLAPPVGASAESPS